MIDPSKLEQGIEILLVDDHAIVRQGLKSLLSKDSRYRVTAEASSAREAVAAVDLKVPDLAIVDITLEDSVGLELIKDLRAREFEFPILVMSMHEEVIYAERVLKAGGNGYVMKSELSEELFTALERLCEGKIHVSPAMQERFLEQAAGLRKSKNGIDMLSDRELEVFQFIGNGKSTREIADELTLSVKTIETHRAHIKEKLDITSTSKLASVAARWVEQRGIS